MTGMFVFHDAYDRDRASDGVSRFGVYLRRHPRLFGDEEGAVTTDPGEFAAAAWQVATSPIMAPPYLECTAERVQSVTFTGSEDGFALIARVQVAVPRPDALADVRGFADWDRGDRWNRGYHVPADAALARRPAILTSSLLLYEIGNAELPVPNNAPDTLTADDAKASVRALAALVTARMAPIMAALDSAGVR